MQHRKLESLKRAISATWFNFLKIGQLAIAPKLPPTWGCLPPPRCTPGQHAPQVGRYSPRTLIAPPEKFQAKGTYLWVMGELKKCTYKVPIHWKVPINAPQIPPVKKIIPPENFWDLGAMQLADGRSPPPQIMAMGYKKSSKGLSYPTAVMCTSVQG